MAGIAKEIYKIARKKGWEGTDTYDIDKAVGAVTEGITGTPSPTYGTIAEALSDLCDAVGSGGGGGGDFGALVGITFVTSAPVADGSIVMNFDGMVDVVMTADGADICMPLNGVGAIASGVKAKAYIGAVTSADPYFATVKQSGGDFVYDTVATASVEVTVTEGTGDDQGSFWASWVMPEPPVGASLFIHTHS